MKTLLKQLENTRNNLLRRYPLGLETVNADYARLERIYHEVQSYYSESLLKGWTSPFHKESLGKAIAMYIQNLVRFEDSLIRTIEPERILLLSDSEIKSLTSLEKVFEVFEYFNQLGPTKDTLTYVGTKKSMVCYHHPSGMLAVNWRTLTEADASARALRRVITTSA